MTVSSYLQRSRKYSWVPRTTAAFIGCLAAAGSLAAGEGLAENPYAPAYGHPYRHGAVPTREAAQQMRDWEASRSAAHRRRSKILAFGGGIDGIGVTSGTPRVYLVFYGSQWTSGGDPHGAATYLQNLFRGIGTGGEMWSGTMTQYCDGPTVPRGATTCNPGTTPHVRYPSAGALAGVWFDTAAPSPSSATITQLAQEAIRGAGHFGNTTAAANRYAQYVVVSPSGTHPDGFGSANFCAWHTYTTSSYGDIAFTNMPYVTDLGASCGENFVNSGSAGLLDGVLNWDQASIRCVSGRHRAEDNPLRRAGRLNAICGIEFAAQAMAVHGRLAGGVGQRPQAGYLASLRDVKCQQGRLDLLEPDLVI